MTKLDDIFKQLPKLTGQPISGDKEKLKENLKNNSFFNQGGLGYSQFNELLLTLGYDRVTKGFFKYLLGKEAEISSLEKLEISNLEKLKQGVEKFREDAMLLYGHIKYGFKRLSQMEQSAIDKELQSIKSLSEEHYTKRHEPLHKLEPIPSDKASYLGYIIEEELKEKLEQDPTNKEFQSQKEEMERYRQLGRKNHDAYLVSDHMDVYIATSMREPQEFSEVSTFVKKLFGDESLKHLKLRYFDPTQAYCKDRIDKGLVEGLMIKRSRCTIYHVQESDTFGKDSELAATLAQGKPVIAYIREIPEFDVFKENTLKQLKQEGYSEENINEGLLKQLQKYYPKGAWENQKIKDWVGKKSDPDDDEMMAILREKVTTLYNKRAETLKRIHPLGLQVNLSTGVANGVLVVRSIEDCAQLLQSILLNQMKFEIVETPKEEESDKKMYCLRENISKCIYRVDSGDDFLINAFWNFYLKT